MQPQLSNKMEGSMGFTDWLKNKSFDKSKSNIIGCLPSLVAAVRADLEGAIDQMPNLGQMDEALERWKKKESSS